MSRERTLVLSGASYVSLAPRHGEKWGRVAYVVGQVLAVVDGALACD